MESDTERGVGSFGNDGEELSPMMTITSLNRGMDSIVAKAGTLSTLDNIKGITSFERKFKRAIASPKTLPPDAKLANKQSAVSR